MLMSQSFRVMKSRLSMYRPSWLNLTSEMLEMISEKKLRAACTHMLTMNAASGLAEDLNVHIQCIWHEICEQAQRACSEILAF